MVRVVLPVRPLWSLSRRISADQSRAQNWAASTTVTIGRGGPRLRGSGRFHRPPPPLKRRVRPRAGARRHASIREEVMKRPASASWRTSGGGRRQGRKCTRCSSPTSFSSWRLRAAPPSATKRASIIHLAHVVHDHGHAEARAVVENVVEECRLPAPKNPERTVTGRRLRKGWRFCIGMPGSSNYFLLIASDLQ